MIEIWLGLFPALSLNCCVILGKSLNLPVYISPICKQRDWTTRSLMSPLALTLYILSNFSPNEILTLA